MWNNVMRISKKYEGIIPEIIKNNGGTNSPIWARELDFKKSQ
jgi:hypothetical protein